MSVFNLKTANQPNAEKAKPEFYANIGIPSVGKISGEPTFLSFPFGIGFDVLTPRVANGQNQDHIDEVDGGNLLWAKALAEARATLAPGEAMVTHLMVEIRRVKSTLEPSPVGSNPHSDAIAKLSVF